MQKRLKILISPLNWGLGHASRDIPVIDTLIEQGHSVFIGGSGDSIVYLKEYYDESKFIYINSPKIKYGKKNAIGPGFAISLVGFLKSIYRDYFALKRIYKREKFDLVISDNRPGLFSKDITSIYITHQVNVKTRKPNRLSGKLVKLFHAYMIKQFDYCIIPDNSGNYSLAGELSYIKKTSNTYFAGVLSRFYNDKYVDEKLPINSPFILVLISGPEPHRTLFEDIVIQKFKDTKTQIVIVRGVVGYKQKNERFFNIKYYNNPSDSVLYALIKRAEVIFCRSGYSTLMDLAVCRKKAILVPTPGQPEQEYLARHFNEKFGFNVCLQKDLLRIKFCKVVSEQKWEYPFDPKKLKKVLDLCLK